MKILHYALGFPPYRSGGLTKYVTDLMEQQKKDGNDVAMLWPGSYSLMRSKVWIEKKKSKGGTSDSFELHNPLPIPLMDGISKIGAYTKEINKDSYREFLKEEGPDIIHMHTLMGIHKEFLEVASDLGIPIFYTAHDYFPVCPKVTLFYQEKICNGMGENCENCNAHALPLWKIAILQSVIYRKVKETSMVRYIRTKHKVYAANISTMETESSNSCEDYSRLKRYYKECMAHMDGIHYVSKITQEQYEKNEIWIRNKWVFPVTHRNIKDCRKRRTPNEIIQFAYMADSSSYKGWNLLASVMDKLWNDGMQCFRLNIYSDSVPERPYIIRHQPYSYSDMENVLESIDMVIVPSCWLETFGLVVLEALSYGIPVMVSENVGAKEVILSEKKPKGLVVEPNKKSLTDAILKICENNKILAFYNENILEDSFTYSLEEHCKTVEKIYMELKKG